MKLAKTLIVLVLMLSLVGCTAIRRKLGLDPEHNFLIITEKSDATLEKKGDTYKKLKKMTGPSNTVIIYDASASMQYLTPIGDGVSQPRYKLAYKGLTRIAKLFNEDDQVWLLVFGSKVPFELTESKSQQEIDFDRAYQAHQDVELIYGEKEAGFNYNTFISKIHHLKSGKSYIGDTPIGYAITRAAALLEGSADGQIILLTDGQETGPLLDEYLSQWPDRKKSFKRSHPRYDQVTISASQALEQVENKTIYFTPILVGLKSVTPERETSPAEIEATRGFYQELARESGSVYLEATSADELTSAFINAEIMNLSYDLYQDAPKKPEKKVASGNIGVPIYVKPGDYRLVIHTMPPFQDQVAVKGGYTNVYVLTADSQGNLRIDPQGQ